MASAYVLNFLVLTDNGVWLRRVDWYSRSMGVELAARVICTVQVTVENATESQLLLGTGFLFPGLLGGVGTQEVMEPVPMWHVLLQEMYLGKRFEMTPGTLLGHRHHRCPQDTPMSGPGCRPSSRKTRAVAFGS